MAGVSIKTLHHYDEKGLLVPSRQQTNGYRVYSGKHLLLLQQILIYRELDFSINEIKGLLKAEGHDAVQVLLKQKTLLLERRNTIEKMIKTIEVTVENIQGKKNFDILFEDIPKEKTERWENIAREREGEQQIAESMSTMARVEESEMRELKVESVRITEEFAKTIGQPFDCELVQQITKAHYEFATAMLNTVAKANGKLAEVKIDYQTYVDMANSVDFQDVNELCEHYGEGYAEHARQAMICFAEKQLK